MGARDREQEGLWDTFSQLRALLASVTAEDIARFKSLAAAVDTDKLQDIMKNIEIKGDRIIIRLDLILGK